MTTSPIGAGTAASAGSNSNSSSTANSATSLTANFNTFLTLLTTQLQNQDPLSPMDTSQFTNQLVEFSQVEQQINTNSNLTQLIGLQSAGESISALPLVGDTIEYNSPTASVASGGGATYAYTLPSDSSATELQVTNANGDMVYEAAGQTAAGTYALNWNGVGNVGAANGVQVPAGDYTLKVAAAGANNSTITATVDSTGTVASVGVQNGTASFTIGDMSVPLSQLVTVNPKLSQTN